MIDYLLLLVVGVVTWMVASDGAWGAAITLVSVLLAGLLAMNFFEPVADFLGRTFLTSYEWQHRWDIVALLGIFAGGVFGLRTIAERLLPTYAPVDSLAYEFARWGLGLCTGYVVMAIILTSLHVAPLSREFLGFVPERGNFFTVAPDRQWLGFTQYVSENSLCRGPRPDGSRPIFDGPIFPAIPGDPKTTQVWAMFPIKYAARRERYASGQSAAARPSTPVSAPPSTPGRPAGGNSGTGGF